MSRALITLMLCTFTIGTAESVIAGILPPIAHDTDVSLRAVGMLITLYALVVVITGPLVTALCSRLSRRTVLTSCMSVFAAGNLVCALSPGYAGLVTGRAVSALAHSTVIAVAVACARDLAPPHRKARATAQVTLGIGLATVVGVPAGTALGEQFGWRITFATLTLLSVVSVPLLTSSQLPSTPPRRDPARAGHKRRPRPWLPPSMIATATVIVCGTAGVFTLYTYAVPFLTQETGLAGSLTTSLLLLYGLGGIAGNTLGARLADRSHQRAALIALAVGTTGLLALAATRHNPLAAAALLTLTGLAYFATIPALNAQIVACAPRSDPAVALAVNNSAFCVGIALGSWLGGALITDRPLALLPLAAAALTGLALLIQSGITWTTRTRSARPATTDNPSHASPRTTGRTAPPEQPTEKTPTTSH
ncbi:MFS transporter [Streptomyces violascens]|uniref:MFS transporter n=1 Tax=Streptomyces violascens TaxID=67381 RepID=UPI0036C72903